MAHLLELRQRLLRATAAVLGVFLVLAPFAQELFHLLARPLLAQLPEGSGMIATEVAAPFLTPFKLSFMLAFVVALPYVLHQAWAFVAPGLYRRERRIALPLLVSSVALFYLGMAFAYFVVFPIMFRFFVGVAPEGVAVMTDIARYLDFVVKLFFAFGLAFEVPVATYLLVRAGAVEAEALARGRPYVVVGAFVVGMLLTPPDVLSQTLLAVPMWLLFELGLWLARRARPGEEEEGGEDEEAGERL